MRAPRQTEGSSASAVTHGSPVTSPRRRRRQRSRDFEAHFPLDLEQPRARVGAPIEEVKGGGYWKLPRDFPHLPTRASFWLGTRVGGSPGAS